MIRLFASSGHDDDQLEDELDHRLVDRFARCHQDHELLCMRTLDEERCPICNKKVVFLRIKSSYYLEYNHEDWEKEAGDELPYLILMFFCADRCVPLDARKERYN